MFGRKKNEPRKLELTVYSEHISRGEPVDPNCVYLSSSHMSSKLPHVMKLVPDTDSLTVGCYNDYVYYPVRFMESLKDSYVIVPRLLREYLGYDANNKITPELIEVSDKNNLAHVKEMHFGVCKVEGALYGDEKIDSPELTQAIMSRFASQDALYLLKPDQRLGVSVQGKKVELLVVGIELENESLNHTGFQFGVLGRDSAIKFVNYLPEQLNLEDEDGLHDQVVPEQVEIPLDFSKLGVGGHKQIIEQIVRRIFYTRAMGEAALKAYGIKRHAKGVLLYGPPGTGKTLLVTSLAGLFPNSQVKVINGPELMSSYVGASQANIGALFDEAKRHPKKLYIFLFDEVDAIAVKRRDGGGTSADVLNQMVSRLLTEIDGANSAQNVIVFFSTNRKDMVDEALLRAGRVDADFYVGLPELEGRLEILQIHTRDMTTLAADVDLLAIAGLTENYSGAELAKLVQVASQLAMCGNFIEGVDTLKMRDMSSDDELARVTQQHFMLALNEVKPGFGRAGMISDYADKCVVYDDNIKKIIERYDQVFTCFSGLQGGGLNFLIAGKTGVGKSVLAEFLAARTGFCHVQVITPNALAGLSESAQVQYIDSAFAKTRDSREPSVIILDDVEDVIDADSEHRAYNNRLRIKLNALLKQGQYGKNKLIVIATCEDVGFLNRLGIGQQFTEVLNLPMVSLNCKMRQQCAKTLEIICNSLGYSLQDDLTSADTMLVQLPISRLIHALHMHAALGRHKGVVKLGKLISEIPLEFHLQADAVEKGAVVERGVSRQFFSLK